MANAIYPIYKQDLLKATTTVLDLDNNTATDGPFCSLTDTGTHAYSASDQFFSAVASAAQGTDQRITTPTVSATAIFDGDDLTYTAVSGNSVEALTIYRHNSGANTTWSLVAYLDTSITGLPVTPNGGNITVTWNATGIFQL